MEYLVAITSEDEYAVVPVTLGDDRDFSPQLKFDRTDFPALAAAGLHSDAELDKLETITGRSLSEITRLGRPGGLSTDEFMAADEDVLAVIRGDNTKGGQQSIFDDGIEGHFHIRLRRDPNADEMRRLNEKYAHLPRERFDEMIRLLSIINTGEMEPQYIMRYGFYEGHTGWRADPTAIAFIFKLRSLEEIDAALNGKLDVALIKHFAE